MIDLEFIQRLIEAIDESSLDSVEIERGATRIRLSKSPPPAQVVAASSVASTESPATPPATEGGGAAESSGSGGTAADGASPPPTASNLVDVTSPMVGTFYGAPGPDAPAYVELGSTVSPGDTLCIIEAMKLMNELEAEISGTIREILVENAEPVEYGQVLFRIEPA